MSDDWRQPEGTFAILLADLFGRVIANRGEPKTALSGFEPLLSALYRNYDQSMANRLGWMGMELAGRLDEAGGDCAATVKQFCDRLPELIGTPDPSGRCTNVSEMLSWVREIMLEPGETAPASGPRRRR
jgi:hypothetical protein